MNWQPLGRVIEIESPVIDAPTTESQQAETRTSRIVHYLIPKGISQAELRIAILCVEEPTIARIAERAFLAVKSVKYHLTNIYRKAGVQNRMALVQMLLRL